jgi:hypothetical protein
MVESFICRIDKVENDLALVTVTDSQRYGLQGNYSVSELQSSGIKVEKGQIFKIRTETIGDRMTIKTLPLDYAEKRLEKEKYNVTDRVKSKIKVIKEIANELESTNDPYRVHGIVNDLSQKVKELEVSLLVAKELDRISHF